MFADVRMFVWILEFGVWRLERGKTDGFFFSFFRINYGDAAALEPVVYILIKFFAVRYGSNGRIKKNGMRRQMKNRILVVEDERAIRI